MSIEIEIIDRIIGKCSRPCCRPEDLLAYRGAGSEELKYYHTKFCKYCGQIWVSKVIPIPNAPQIQQVVCSVAVP